MGRGGKIGELDEMKRRPHLIGDSLVGLPDQIVWLDLDMVTGTSRRLVSLAVPHRCWSLVRQWSYLPS